MLNANALPNAALTSIALARIIRFEGMNGSVCKFCPFHNSISSKCYKQNCFWKIPENAQAIKPGA